MQYWLVKSEPTTYSWEQFLKDKKTVWEGVRNYAARIHLRGMKKGDLVLFYHSNIDKSVMGISKVVKEAYQDPSTEDDRWVAVDLAPVESFKNPVSLEVIKAEKKLENIGLVKIGRLSVMPLEKTEYDLLCKMGK